MRNRIENASLLVFFGLTTFMMIKLMMFIIGFFYTIGIDTTALAVIG